jgi:hypothetical protein
MQMAMTRMTTLALAALLPLGACQSSTSPEPTVDTFSRNTLANYTSYSDGGANWAISSGQLVGTGPANQSVLIRNGLTFTDGWVEAVSPGADDGGLVLRFQDGSHYYLLAFRDDAAPDPRGTYNLAMYHHVGSEYDQMWVTNVSWPRGTVHTVRFEAAGNLLRAYFDGAKLVELEPSFLVNDPSPYFGAGGAGVRHYGATAAWVSTFDEFRWSAGARL